MKETSLHQGSWKWFSIDFSNKDKIKELTKGYELNREWLDEVGEKKENNLQMDTTRENKEAMWGSLVYKQNPDDADSTSLFHFYLTQEFLITGHFDPSAIHSSGEREIIKRMDQTDSPIDGLMVIMDEVGNEILWMIDQFEEDINELLWKFKETNSEKVLDQLMNVRHQLVIVRNLTIPLSEISIAVEETFGEEVTEKKFYKKVSRRLDRCNLLISEYSQEISTMINLESVTNSTRGNDIMKTLTVITLLYTPVAAWGALWGMNFQFMPELDERLGYLFALLFIFFNTLVLFLYIKDKGWTGDILGSKKE